MTREEIVKAADEAINEFKKIFEFTGDKYGVDTLLDCVILHYEKIVERDKVLFTTLAGIQEQNILSMRVCSIHLSNTELILTELKTRL